jgi:hypothetical protein
MKSTTTKTTTKGIRIKSRVRAGLDGIATNHNQAAKGVRVKSRVRAGSEMVVTKAND